VAGGATKFDAGKAPVHNGFVRYFAKAMIGVAMVSDYGFRKYGTWGGWRSVPDGVSRYTDAKTRHQVAQEIEGAYDITDSGLPHCFQEAWNALARCEKLLDEGAVQIMRGNDIENGKPILGTARVL
jgi:hypothetical protein